MPRGPEPRSGAGAPAAVPRRLGPVLLASLLALAPPSARSQPGPLRLGTVLPLTGPLAPVGAAVEAGMLVWVEEANAAGGVAGRRVGLIAADGGGEPARTADAVRMLADRGRVAAVLGVCCGLPEMPPPVGGLPVLFPVGGGFGASTPPWARFGPGDVAGLLREADEAVPPSFFEAHPGFAPLVSAFRAWSGGPPTRAALLGYAVMRGFAEAVAATGQSQPDLAALSAIPPDRLPVGPYFDPEGAAGRGGRQ